MITPNIHLIRIALPPFQTPPASTIDRIAWQWNRQAQNR
jgi:hypothetical protein